MFAPSSKYIKPPAPEVLYTFESGIKMSVKTVISAGVEAAPPYSENSTFETSFASLSLHRLDRIRLLQFPQEEVDGIRNVIRRDWKQGIQNETSYHGSWEFKCRGNPWFGQGSEATPARILMRGIFAYLFEEGWILTITTDVSKKIHDKDTLIFRKQLARPPPSDWIAISFNKGDRLRLIGAPADLVAAFETMLKSNKTLQDKCLKENDSYEFKLNGYPWVPTGGETLATRVLVLKMLETLERYGWSLYASIDQNTGSSSQSSGETDSWYCVRAIDWVPGNAVYH